MTDQIAASQLEKCKRFEALHADEGAFVIANPWDVGSAKILEGLGFKALATTSGGLAMALGRKDGEVTLDEKLAHCRSLAANTSVPINVDFENGFADTAEGVAANVKLLAETGVAGCSIEDFDRVEKRLYDFGEALERIQAASEAVAALDMPFQLTARAENFLRGVKDMDDTIKRLNAYSDVGAHVNFAPGINTLDQLREITAATNKPFNVIGVFFKGVTVAEFSEAGAKRISVGGALTYAAANPLIIAGKEMLEHGTFNWLAGMASGKEIAKLMG